MPRRSSECLAFEKERNQNSIEHFSSEKSPEEISGYLRNSKSSDKEAFRLPNKNKKSDNENQNNFHNVCEILSEDKLPGTFVHQKLSVFDLVADDPLVHPKISQQEPHVSFAIQGLGKVGSETPRRSPYPRSRNKIDRSFSKSKSTKGSNTEKLDSLLDFDFELNHIIHDDEIPKTSNFSPENSFYDLNLDLFPQNDYKQWQDRSPKISNSCFEIWCNENEWDDLFQDKKNEVSSPLIDHTIGVAYEDNDRDFFLNSPNQWFSSKTTKQYGTNSPYNISPLHQSSPPMSPPSKRYSTTKTPKYDWSCLFENASEESCSTSAKSKTIISHQVDATFTSDDAATNEFQYHSVHHSQTPKDPFCFNSHLNESPQHITLPDPTPQMPPATSSDFSEEQRVSSTKSEMAVTAQTNGGHLEPSKTMLLGSCVFKLLCIKEVL